MPRLYRSAFWLAIVLLTGVAIGTAALFSRGAKEYSDLAGFVGALLILVPTLDIEFRKWFVEVHLQKQRFQNRDAAETDAAALTSDSGLLGKWFDEKLSQAGGTIAGFSVVHPICFTVGLYLIALGFGMQYFAG
jgi:hypothetical protein